MVRRIVSTVWHRKWWILAPTALTAVTTSALSHSFLPPRYRSESTIRIVSPRVTGEYARPTVTETAGTRFEQSRQQVLHIEEVRGRILAYEDKLKSLRAHSGPSLSQADLLPYEVLQERYRTLLVQAAELSTAANLERRQIGEQFRLVSAARLPERPVGPSRLSVTLAGTFAGFGLGLILVIARSRSQKTSG